MSSSGYKNMSKTQREDKILEIAKVVGIVVGAVAGIAVVGWGVSKLFSGSGPSSTIKKMMEAPGRDCYIYMEDFEQDPSGYFRSLRD
ncbi:unnamed protein product [Ilex paraguariensis]|uniref:Uncharacterized protein n=1 Tax=Ilex paraguariensis TaxID=185542 RepID=A0ABC8RKA2_9AQUA